MGLRVIPANLARDAKAKVTRDTAGNPGGGDAGGPRRPSGRRRTRAGAERANPESADEGAWTTELTGSQRVFPGWDGVPGYELEGRRYPGRPRADHGRTGPRGPRPGSPGEPPQFRYTPTVSQPMRVPPAAGTPWLRDESGLPGFEFDAHAPSPASMAPPEPRPRPRPALARAAPAGARAEWVRLVRSFLPEPVRRNWFAEFRSALHFRGAGTRVIIPIVAMMVFGVAVAVIAGANGSTPGPAPPPAALGFPPATLAGSQFSAAVSGRGISQMLGRVTSDGAEIVAVGSQQGARMPRAQFFVSTDDGRSWSMGRVRTPG